MTIQQILEAHVQHDAVAKNTAFYCLCGWVSDSPRYGAGRGEHHAHVAEVLDKHMQQTRRGVWDRAYSAGWNDEEWRDNPYTGRDHLMGDNEKEIAVPPGCFPNVGLLKVSYAEHADRERGATWATSSNEFDRALAGIRADAKAEALEEAAQQAVKSVEELNVLPVGTIIEDSEPCVLRLSPDDEEWYVPGSTTAWRPEEVDLPARVLYRPEVNN